MFNRILVPLDGSKLAERALSVATTLAEKTDGTMILAKFSDVNLMIPTVFGHVPVYVEHHHGERVEEAKAYLDSVMARPAFRDMAVTQIAKAGDPATLILETAANEAVDLIIMTTHGHRGVTRWALGSVTERILQQAPCPVLVIHNKPLSINSILAPLDGSQLAEHALAPAVAIGTLFDASLTLQFVNEDLTHIDTMSLDLLGQYQPGLAKETREQYTQQGRAYLDTLSDDLSDGLSVHTLLDIGNPALRIIEAAESGLYDMLVICTHGRTGIQRWVYGSVMEKVLRSTTIPILVVRPPANNTA